MNQKVLQQEKAHLSSILAKLEDAEFVLETAINKISGQSLQALKEFRESPETSSGDILQFFHELQQKEDSFSFTDKFKQVEEFGYLLKEPFFARIDLAEGGESKSFYIGKFGYTEEKPVITDWRTKVASVYYRYRYPQKNVFYDAPGGREERDLTLKRTFEIDEGTLVKYYNNDIQLDESQIIAEKIEQRTGGVLEDIVTTIQESQLDIIEADPRQVCVVQGCVGSGKSTVAIHKLSHIFFNFPKVIHPERSILVAKSQILVGYLSTLFPKLGIFDIAYKTSRELVYGLVFKEKLGLNVDFERDQDTGTFGINDIEDLESRIAKVHAEFEEKLNKLFSDPEFSTFKGYKYSKNSTVKENLDEVIADLEEELSLQQGYLKEYPNSFRAEIFKTNIKILKKLVNKVKKIRTELKERAFSEMVKGAGIDKNVRLGYKQTLIYALIYARLMGLCKTLKYEYCVVDEGQDFSALEYSVLNELVLRGRFCILGDLNQSVESNGIADWTQINKVVRDAKNAQVFELETNYRSTKPIIELANKILSPYTKTYLPKSINRMGEEPKVVEARGEDDLLVKFEEELEGDIANLNKSIGVICYGYRDLGRVKDIVEKLGTPKEDVILLDEKKKIPYTPRGVYIMNFEDCKGLEFAKVYVLGLDLDGIEGFEEARRAFVAVTRAMNELSVYRVV